MMLAALPREPDNCEASEFDFALRIAFSRDWLQVPDPP